MKGMNKDFGLTHASSVPAAHRATQRWYLCSPPSSGAQFLPRPRLPIGIDRKLFGVGEAAAGEGGDALPGAEIFGPTDNTLGVADPGVCVLLEAGSGGLPEPLAEAGVEQQAADRGPHGSGIGGIEQ